MVQLKTRWTNMVKEHPEAVHSEYPRPAMVRESFINLNGYWEYAITSTGQHPEVYDGQILVPFSPEAPLSGVERLLKPEEYLWYRRTLPEQVKPDGGRWLLHFGAVDQYARVYVNGRCVCRHLGGYLPFSADVTEALRDDKNELLVVVRDATDRSYHSRGKQKLERGGMFYTAQSGIWQTVWMEQVPQEYIESLVVTPQYDREQAELTVVTNSGEQVPVDVTVWSEEMQPIEVRGVANKKLCIRLREMHSWSPEDPFLYRFRVSAGEDKVDSYFAMRKIAVSSDEGGVPRLYLNNRPYFQKGLLDQGYWPDGLYTAPCDEAMVFDISEMKRLGFNMLRKHIKVEPQRWYYHCDRLGMLVWQDMVCGGRPYRSWHVTYLANVMSVLHISHTDRLYRLFGRKEEKGREQFVSEMKETIQFFYNHPSVVTWVIFNEGWGQFDARKVYEIARRLDSTRTFDVASGWFDQGVGDFRSIHNYFVPLRVKPEKRVTALTECGGYCWHVDGHSMFEEEYGYRKYDSKDSLSKGYRELIRKEILPNIPKGLSAVIYTQLSDIEEEVNGIYTYDREVLKLDENVLIECNREMEY